MNKRKNTRFAERFLWIYSLKIVQSRDKMKPSLIKAFFLLAIASLFYLFFDQRIATSIHAFSKEYRPLFKVATLLIFPPLHLAIWTLAFILARLKKSPLSLPLFEIISAQALSVAFVRVFKVILGRARPDIFIKKEIYGFHGPLWDHHYHSFPSGHTIAAFTLATSLSLLFPRYKALFFLTASLLTLSRVFLLGHFCSDVIGTAALGILIGTSVHLLFNKITKSQVDECPLDL